MASVSIVARKSKSGLSVYVRFSHLSVERYVSLGVHVKRRQWNASGRTVSKTHPDHEQLAALIEHHRREAESALADVMASGVVVTADRIRSRYRFRIEGRQVETEEDFLAFADRHVSLYESRGQYASHKHYGSAVRKLRRFHGRGRLEWDDLTVRFLTSYETWMRRQGNRTNTVHKDLSMIRTILYAAIREGLFDRARNPFDRITLRKEKARKERIRKADVDRLGALDLPAGSMLEIARDMWIFAFFTGGSRVGDLLTLTPGQVRNGRIYYDMRKTGERHGLPLVAQAAGIAAAYAGRKGKYLFPPLESYPTSTEREVFDAIGKATARINRALGRVAKRAGIEKTLTTHIARHSFAAYCIESGWDVYRVSKVLGHADIKITQAYLSGFDRSDLDADFEALFE